MVVEGAASAVVLVLVVLELVVLELVVGARVGAVSSGSAPAAAGATIVMAGPPCHSRAAPGRGWASTEYSTEPRRFAPPTSNVLEFLMTAGAAETTVAP